MSGIGPGQGARSEGVDHCSVLIKLVRQQSPGTVQQQRQQSPGTVQQQGQGQGQQQQQQRKQQQRRRQQQGNDVDPTTPGDGAGAGDGAAGAGVDRSMGLAGGGRVDQVSDEEGEVYDVLVGHNTWDDYQVPANTHPHMMLSMPSEKINYQYTLTVHPINAKSHTLATHTINRSSQYILSVHPISTPYQHPLNLINTF